MLAWGAPEAGGAGRKRARLTEHLLCAGHRSSLEVGTSPRHSQKAQSLWVLVPCAFRGEHTVRGPCCLRASEGLHLGALSPCSAALGGGLSGACLHGGVSLLWRLRAKLTPF